jgi:hypothetical protein
MTDKMKEIIASQAITTHSDGYIYDLETGACNSRCISCPMQLACHILSKQGSYKAFVENYDEYIYPTIKRILDEKSAR